ncbi:hypothetical protein H6F67_14805 [Microcoleus sp. FACHB-1515]|uniref:hypothetical protein n=1 Tax=Cyanophyceae TaxID=3028117 RepID=UPI001687193E|nr:hypothetical protein [Microcoleus sp. FACHB-1515]MBD2091122.1 hypothetical protein [Microcoleus sp. FACHB-1515]
MMQPPRSTLDFWRELRSALALPEQANLKRLCQLLKEAIALLPEPEQLAAAGAAIEQMTDLHALRFNLLMTVWEESEALPEDAVPVLEFEALEAWIRQSMSVDLDVLVEQPRAKRQRDRKISSSADSIVAVVETEAVLQMVEAIEAQHHSMIQDLAGEEDPLRWARAITAWIQFHKLEEPIEISRLLHELQMPWVEVWLGVLLGGFELEQHGEFYEGKILVRC